MIHFFKKPVSHLALPEKFTYPFHYTPHPLCVLAAEEVKAYIASRKEWQEELASGKMFGVLIVQTDNGITNNEENQIGYLAAFSGNLDGKNLHPYFVPPVYDLLQPEGFFKIEEEQISAINIRIRELENSSSYLNSKEKWKIETEQAKAVLNQNGKGGERDSPPVISGAFRRRTSLPDSGKPIPKGGIQTTGKGMEETIGRARNGSQALRY